MIAGVLIEAGVGVLLIVLGLLIWKKRKVSLLHDYHYKNVKEEDVPAYARGMGIGLIVMGAGECVSGVCHLAGLMTLSWVALAVFYAAGIVWMHKIQKKYNGSWFS